MITKSTNWSIQRSSAAYGVAPVSSRVHCTVVPEGFERRPVPAVQPNGSPAQIWELPSGHDCMITKPAELAELLLRLG